MTDVFREVDEEVRREQLKKLWDRYGSYAVAAAVLVVLAVAGWRGYGWWEAKQAAEAGTAFETASNLAEDGKHSEAEAAFAKLASNATASYRHLARVREAAELAHTDAKAAIAAYDKIAADRAVGPVLQELAGYAPPHFSLITACSMKHSASSSRSPEPTELSAILRANCWFWRLGAEEIRLPPSAGSTSIMSDGQTPPATRSRVEVLMALGAGEGRS